MTPKEFAAGLEVLSKVTGTAHPWDIYDDGWSKLDYGEPLPVDEADAIDHRWLIGALSEQIWERGWWVVPGKIEGCYLFKGKREARFWYRTPVAAMTAALDGEGE